MFILKISNSFRPADLRKNSISSVILRRFHRILDVRLIKSFLSFKSFSLNLSTLLLIVLNFVFSAVIDRLVVVIRVCFKFLNIACAKDIMLLTRNVNCQEELLNIPFSTFSSTCPEMNSGKSFTIC